MEREFGKSTQEEKRKESKKEKEKEKEKEKIEGICDSPRPPPREDEISKLKESRERAGAECIE